MSPLESKQYGIIDHVIGGDDAGYKIEARPLLAPPRQSTCVQHVCMHVTTNLPQPDDAHIARFANGWGAARVLTSLLKLLIPACLIRRLCCHHAAQEPRGSRQRRQARALRACRARRQCSRGCGRGGARPRTRRGGPASVASPRPTSSHCTKRCVCSALFGAVLLLACCVCGVSAPYVKLLYEEVRVLLCPLFCRSMQRCG